MFYLQFFIVCCDVGSDFYVWLEECDVLEVFDYLKVENVYLDSELVDQVGLCEILFEEIRGCICEIDLLLFSLWGLWLYYQCIIVGDEYLCYYCCLCLEDGSLVVDEGVE